MSEHSRGKLWGGRFAGGTAPEIDRFTVSLPFDRRLLRFDLVGSLGHARMLLERRVIPSDDARAILRGLAAMLEEADRGALVAEGPDEDVHTFIERTLRERIGESAARLHTARSRNDQTATALRLFVRHQLAELLDALAALAGAWLEVAARHTETLMPGYTHLQRAKPVTLAHHLLAHVWSLLADGERLLRCHTAAARCPLGAGALAGTSHPIDPHRSAALLGFDRPYPNSMHAVADRDYVVEASFACALLLVHLSRWAEEVVLWSSSEFGFVQLGDYIANGSSLMPQKKNPEPAEILRGKSARVIGDLVAHLVMLKGLPLTYNSDLQEDKEALFDALDTTRGALEAARAIERGLVYREAAMARALEGGFATATELADLLVRKGMAFRTAHERVGAVVRAAELKNLELWQLGEEELRALLPGVEAAELSVLAPAAAVAAHRSYGGPAPERVREQLGAAHAERSALEARRARLAVPPIERLAREGRLHDDALDLNLDDPDGGDRR